MAKKKAKKAGKKRKPNAAFMKAMTPSSTLAAVVGSSAMPRTEVTKKIWGYIKRNGLQDKKNKRMINADDKLKSVFGGRNQVSMFEMTKLVSLHFKYPGPFGFLHRAGCPPALSFLVLGSDALAFFLEPRMTATRWCSALGWTSRMRLLPSVAAPPACST